MNTGYFIENGNAIMKGIDTEFTQAFREIVTSFETVRSEFRSEWVGADEISFENKLIEKLNLLSADTHKYARAAVDVVRGMLESWVTFQDINTMDGASSGASEQLMGLIENVTVMFPTQISSQNKTFSSSDQLGLKSGSSSTILHNTLNTYVNDVKSKIEGIFTVVDSNQAFYGDEQMQGFKNYMDKIKETMQDIQTSIKDLDEIMTTLVSQYQSQDTSVNTQLEEGRSSVESSVDLGNTRWTV